MLADEHARRLAGKFACQWLPLRNFDENVEKKESLEVVDGRQASGLSVVVGCRDSRLRCQLNQAAVRAVQLESYISDYSRYTRVAYLAETLLQLPQGPETLAYRS